jgi:hypothetical protein
VLPAIRCYPDGRSRSSPGFSPPEGTPPSWRGRTAVRPPLTHLRRTGAEATAAACLRVSAPGRLACLSRGLPTLPSFSSSSSPRSARQSPQTCAVRQSWTSPEAAPGIVDLATVCTGPPIACRRPPAFPKVRRRFSTHVPRTDTNVRMTDFPVRAFGLVPCSPITGRSGVPPPAPLPATHTRKRAPPAAREMLRSTRPARDRFAAARVRNLSPSNAPCVRTPPEGGLQSRRRRRRRPVATTDPHPPSGARPKTVPARRAR